jgi:uncharacterized SAM-binding protein YcdF (DUF218 family)
VTYVQPLLLTFLLIVALGLYHLRKSGRMLLPALGLVGLFLLVWPPAAWLFSRILDARYPERPFSPQSSAQAIVLIASAVIPPQYGIPYAVPDKETFGRCEYAAWLHTHGQPLPVLACGGPGAKGEQPASVTMRRLIQQAGVPDSMIWTEERSRSTHENAAFGAEILRKHGISKILLVTDAEDMLRAELCFRKEGLVVIPAPSSFHAAPKTEELMPSWKAIDRNERTLHETLGLAWYWIRGWI